MQHDVLDDAGRLKLKDSYIKALETKNGELEAECTRLREQLRTLALGPREASVSDAMKNYQVASCFIVNALAYLESGDRETVANNLRLIAKLLEHPNDENAEYEWEDFK